MLMQIKSILLPQDAAEDRLEMARVRKMEEEV